MNFNFLRTLRILLFPFSLIYGLIVIVRNFLFDRKVIKCVSFDLPVIAVGNLSAGGTGKSPMVEYLLKILKNKYKIATLSRGYKRKTTGYLLAGAQTNASEIGDEPMQFHRKFPEVAVAVGEERIVAIPQLLQERPEIEVIILDDAFQHRSVKPGFNILLTEYRKLFTRDFFLPTGDLRDSPSSYKRADTIVVTKSPINLSLEEKEVIKKELNPLPHQKIFFTVIDYGRPYHILNKEETTINVTDEVLLVCGIANPEPFKNYVSAESKSCSLLSFPDHHAFTNNDIKEIKKKFYAIDSKQKLIITTEKDAVRLLEYEKEWEAIPAFVIPVQHKFLFGEGMQFDNIVNTFIEMFPADKKLYE